MTEMTEMAGMTGDGGDEGRNGDEGGLIGRETRILKGVALNILEMLIIFVARF